MSTDSFPPGDGEHPPASSTRVRRVACPSCRTEVEWSTDNPFRPFCSKRCKLTDLGAWASGAYRLPVPDDPPGAESDDFSER